MTLGNSMLSRFILIGLVATAAVAAVVAVAVNRYLMVTALHDVIDDASDVVAHLVVPMVEERHFAGSTVANTEHWDLWFRQLVGVAHIDRVAVWNVAGTELYRSGARLGSGWQEGLAEAARGRTVGRRDAAEAGSQAGSHYDIYVPVVLPGEAAPRGVFMISKDYDAIVAELQDSRLGVWLGSFLVFSLLFTALAAILAASRRRHMAYHDPLTNLANRHLLDERVRRLLATAPFRERSAALLFLDLARFKAVNDSFGHGAGDETLRQVAARLQDCVGERDLVGRVGGDEFAILVHGSEGRATAVAGCVHQAFAHPYIIAAQPLHLNVNVGVALLPTREDLAVAGGADFSTETWLTQADTAMYRSKVAGTPHQVYRQDMNRYTRERLRLEEDLRVALAEEQFVLYYQPLVAPSGEVVGTEALIRWQHPERGVVSPGEFIPLAEEIGLIRQLDRWVAKHAALQANHWRALGTPLRVAVNLSPQTFQDADFSAWLDATLSEIGLPAALLTCEVTEYVLAQTERSRQALEALTALGVEVALDDFGTGYSSLAYLEALPIDRIKIDRQFVQGIGQRPAAEAIVRTILALTRNLGIESLGEGIETEAQLHWLLSEGCDLFQGFYFGRPVPAHALTLSGRTSAAAAAALPLAAPS